MAAVRLDLLEWQTHGPAERDYRLAGVSLADQPGLSDLAATLTRSGMLSVRELRQGLEISTKSYVGRLRLGDLVVTVHPKIPLVHLMQLMRYAYGLRRLHRFDLASFETEPDGFLDLLLLQLTAEVGELLERGLHRRYVRMAEDLATPRGRIDFQGLARRRDVAAVTLPCVHYPRSEDILINRVLLAGLRLGGRLTADQQLRAALRRQAAILADHVTDVALDQQVLQLLAQTDRLTAAYRPALAIIRLLADGVGMSLDDVAALPDSGPDPGRDAEDRGQRDGRRPSRGDHVALPGFLFDMNRFFQALLGRFLTDHLPGYTVLQEYQLRGMMSYMPEHNPRHRRAPTPRPDFAIAQGGRVIALLDAKYRDLWELGLPDSWLYQLSIYALSQGPGGRSTILYPTMADGAREQRISISHPSAGERAQVVLRPVHMGRLAEAVGEGRVDSRMAQASRIALATALAFGTDGGRAADAAVREFQGMKK